MNVELVRSEGQYPVPAHGGHAVMVTWSLKVNGVRIVEETDRYPWHCDPRKRALLGAQPPAMMKETYDRLLETC